MKTKFVVMSKGLFLGKGKPAAELGAVVEMEPLDVEHMDPEGLVMMPEAAFKALKESVAAEEKAQAEITKLLANKAAKPKTFEKQKLALKAIEAHLAAKAGTEKPAPVPAGDKEKAKAGAEK